MDLLQECRQASDERLTEDLLHLRKNEREDLASIIAHLVEFERRELPQRKGQPSLFHYCVEVLGYSEAEAGWRVYTARAVRRFPVILEMLQAGKLHMTAVVTLSPHLTPENHRELLAKVQGLSKTEIEFLVAGLVPRADLRDMVRGLGDGAPAALALAPSPLSVPESSPQASEVRAAEAAPKDAIAPIAEERVRIAFTASRRLLAKIDRLKGLLRHCHPSGNLEPIFEEAVDSLLEQRDPERRIARKLRRRMERAGPAAAAEDEGSRRLIPQKVKDEVWLRDQGRCAFVSAEGIRCQERGWLEYDHVVPWALGGRSDEPGNIRLLCRTHNQHLARLVFGPRAGPRQQEPEGSRA